MAERKKPRRPKRAKKMHGDKPIPLSRTLESVRRSGAPAPAGLARASIADGLLALADPTRRDEHVDAAQCVAEGVTLAAITAARELVDLHDANPRAHGGRS
jgi:hypothetical protein